MNTDEIVFAVIDFLNDHHVPYMIVGSLATNFYCVPRSTQDGDIVVQSNLPDLARQISQHYTSIHFDPQLTFESVTATQKVVLRTTGHHFEIELFKLSDDEYDQIRFSRRIRVDALSRSVWISSVEDMIITKLRWSQHAGREKDIADVRNLIGVQQDSVNWSYVESWCDRQGTAICWIGCGRILLTCCEAPGPHMSLQALKGQAPAMASGLSNYVWTIKELIARAAEA